MAEGLVPHDELKVTMGNEFLRKETLIEEGININRAKSDPEDAFMAAWFIISVYVGILENPDIQSRF